MPLTVGDRFPQVPAHSATGPAAQIGRFGILRYAAFSPRKLARASYAHVSTSAADIPPSAEVVRAVQAAGSA